MQKEKLIIIGSGPAGLTAAIYAARANLNPLLIAGNQMGGQIAITNEVENFPGFDSVLGPELTEKMRVQAERFGTRFETDLATRVELSTEVGGVHSVWVGDTQHRARTVILAMGAEHKKLGVPGEDLLSGRGVSYCATCDAAFFAGKETLIVGGGDSAMEEAIFLAKFSSKVTIINRRDEFRASQIMLDRARAVPNIEWLTPYVVDEFQAGETGPMTGAQLRHAETGETRQIAASGAFIAVGHVPQSEIVAGQVQTDAEGYVATEGRSTRTGLPGVFAAGDLVDHTYRQAVTAAGSGCQAALDAEWYLRDTPQAAAAAGDLAPAS